MPRYAMTFTPDVEETQDGTTHYNLNTAEVYSDAPRQEIRADVAQEYNDGFYTDTNTDEVYHQIDASDDDLTNLVNDFGGQDYYDQALEWARYALPQDAIEEYDEVMASGDITEIANYLQQLKEVYEEQGSPEVEFSEAEQYIFDNVISHQDYQVVASWARENLDANTIDKVNLVLGSGDTQKMTAVALGLKKLYLQNNSDY